MRSKIVHYGETGGGEPNETLSIGGSTRVRIKAAVARHQINVTVRIGHQPIAAHPNTRHPIVGSGVKQRHLLKSHRVVTEYPPMVGKSIAMRSEGHIDVAVQQ